jgi:hypothetical protein
MSQITDGYEDETRPARAERRAAASAAHGGRKKFGWRVNEFAHACGCSRAFVYILISRGRIQSVKLGRSRVILTHPGDFLEGLQQR